jgi:hypothetical protein
VQDFRSIQQYVGSRVNKDGCIKADTVSGITVSGIMVSATSSSYIGDLQRATTSSRRAIYAMLEHT